MESLLNHPNNPKDTTVISRRSTKHKVPNSVLNKRHSGKDVPKISVTETRDSPLPLPSIPYKKARTPRLHMISSHYLDSQSGSKNSHDDFTSKANLLHHGVLDLLQEHFFVRMTQPSSCWHGEPCSRDRASKRYKLSESDACIFLFNDPTMEDAGCFHELCTALALKIPIIFVKHYSQELPKTFAESVQINSQGCVSLSEYIDKFVLGNHRTVTGKSITGKKRLICPNNRLAPLSVRTRSSSASDLNVEGFNLKRGGNTQKSAISEIDLLLYLINNFQKSYIFDESQLPRCANQLRLGIYDSIGMSECERELNVTGSNVKCKNELNHRERRRKMGTSEQRNKESDQTDLLNVPEAENMLLAREWGISGSVSAPPQGKPRQEDRFNYDFHTVSPTPVEQKCTTYLVFDDKKNEKTIRRINFPLDDNEVTEGCGDTDSDESDPCSSPIHFSDIDLAREITQRMDTPEFE